MPRARVPPLCCPGLIRDLAPYCVSAYNTLGDEKLDAMKSAAAQVGAAVAAGAAVAPVISPDPAVAGADGSASSSPPAATAIGVSGCGSGPRVLEVVNIKSMGNFSQKTFAKLVAVKTRYDPNNIFTNNNNIKPCPQHQQA